jgi:hypothetical protein
MSAEGYKLTESEIVALSEDCDYVYKKVTSGLKKIRGENKYLHSTSLYTTFHDNELLISLMKKTPCLDGKTEGEILKLFGKTFKQGGSSESLLKYYFFIEGNKYHELSFWFENNSLVRKNVWRFSAMSAG